MSPLGIEYKRLYEKLDHAPVTFDMLQTKEVPNWFNAISSEYIKRFALNNKVTVAFAGDGVVNSKPEGDDIGHLWLETTFNANESVTYDFQYVTSADVTTCCHSFDITTLYASNSDPSIRVNNSQLYDVRFAKTAISDFPGYFNCKTRVPTFYFNQNVPIYKKGIDDITKETKMHYSVKNGFFYLTVNYNFQHYKNPAGYNSFTSPVNFSNQVYNIGFPLIIPTGSATFLQSNPENKDISQNYFLFSPWHVYSISRINGFYNDRGGFIDFYSYDQEKISRTLIKTWGDHLIYKQKADEERTPGKPNVLFAEKNSVITYAMQHKALFSQRCLYVVNFKEVKGGDFIGLKTYSNLNTGKNFDTVIWWSVEGQGKAPTDVTAREFKEVKATKKTTPEELADMIASSINNRGTTMFNIPTISDKTYDYYIRY